MTPIPKWKKFALELAAALAMASVIVTVAQLVADRQRALTPAESWFQVNEIFVPDFEAGGNPTLVYDTVALEPFDAFRIVEVQRQAQSGLWETVCSAAEVYPVNPASVWVSDKVTWGWLLAGSCVMEPARYRLRVTYTLSRLGWPAKRVFAISNEFNVRA